MRCILIFFYFPLLMLTFSCQRDRAPAGNQDQLVKHIVFDLDWTLVSNLYNHVGSVNGHSVRIADEVYRLNDFALNLIEELSKRSDVKISFYSAGTKVRNDELLRKVKLPSSGKSLYDLAYKRLHYDDLETTGVSDEGVSFAEKFKKDLLKITSDLENLIMIDDDIRFAKNGLQEKSFLWIGTQFLYFDSFEQSQAALKLDPENIFIPKTYQEWVQSRLKLAMVGDIVLEALDAESSIQSFNRRVQTLAKEINIIENDVNAQKSLSLRKGWQRLAPQKNLSRLLNPNLSCRTLIAPLL